MIMVTVPYYRDLFDGRMLGLEELLDGIPSEVIVGLLAMIHSEFQLETDEVLVQDKILQLFLQRQPISVQRQFRSRLIGSSHSGSYEKSGFFSMTYVLEFMHYVLVNYNDNELHGDTTPDHEYRLLKAYVVFIELRNDKDKKIFDHNRSHADDFFFKNTLPMLSGQYEAAHHVNPFLEMIRGLVFLNYIQFYSPYGNCVDKFLKQRGFGNSMHLGIEISKIIQSSWVPIQSDGKKSGRFIIHTDESFEPMFQSIVMDIAAYKSEFSKDHRNYTGIKDKPVLSLGKNTYLVLNWNFLSNKLYEGLLFDFYHSSGIKEAGNFKTFPNFKQFVGKHITEEYLFNRLLTASLDKKGSVLLFDKKEKDGFPDAYYRDENIVIIFEIKDAFFPSKAINTISYDNIKNAIDTKYNQTGKGTGQLINQLEKLAGDGFEQSNTKIDSNGLTVYPVMVYTDHFFSMPGINQYLQQEFDKKLAAANLKPKYNKIKPLVFMDIRFLISHLDLIKLPDSDLVLLFESYYQSLVRAENNVRTTDSLSAFFDCYQTFESAVAKTHARTIYKRDGYVKMIIEALEITKGFKG